MLKSCKYYKDLGSKNLDSLHVITRCFDKTASACGLPQNCTVISDIATLQYTGGQPILYPNDADTLNLLRELSDHDFSTTPNVATLIRNLGKAAIDSAKTGFKTVSSDVSAERKAICLKCVMWNDLARMGLGRCNHPRCGCTSLKAHLASGSCPLNRWPK